MSAAHLLLPFLLLQVAVYSQASSFQFVEGECSQLHILYDQSYPGSFFRDPIDKVADGLGLVNMITKNATEASAHYGPDLRDMSISREDLRKLVKVLLLPSFIANRPVQERIGFEAPTGALSAVVNDLCSVIRRHLSGVYKAFTCSEEELKDLDARLAYADLLESHSATIASFKIVTHPLRYQCQYWNTRGLDGCEIGSSVPPKEFEVHENVVRPLYEQHCHCGPGPLQAPLCSITAVTS